MQDARHSASLATNTKRTTRQHDMEDAHGALPTEAVGHLDGLYNLARWLVHDPAEAEDLVQDTYVRALGAAHQFQPGTNLRAWLFQILRNVFYTRHKRRGREPEALDPEALDALAGAVGREGRVLRVADGQDGTLGADLATALERLPEEYRTVVLLADLEDFTMGEIATIMKCPVGTVKSRLFRARGILQELLRDYVG